MELFKQGAEAKLFKTVLFGRNVIVKQRFKKTYRHPQLDTKLTHKRTLQEVRAMLKCRKAGIKTPLLYFVNYVTHEIFMEEIQDSYVLKDEINSLLKLDRKEDRTCLENIATTIGYIIAKMHSVEIIHGDLTTSNILMTKLDGQNVFTMIDFGLSITSNLNEDMGVDLYVLERAFLSTHPNTEWLFKLILNSYIKNFVDQKKVKEVIAKLEEVRSRGRKRVMIG